MWVSFLVSLVVGFDWKKVVEEAVNSGKPIEGALALAILVPTLVFLAARSMLAGGTCNANCGAATSSGSPPRGNTNR